MISASFAVGLRRIEVLPIGDRARTYVLRLLGEDGREVARRVPVTSEAAGVESAFSWLVSWGTPPTAGERYQILAIAEQLDGKGPPRLGAAPGADETPEAGG